MKDITIKELSLEYLSENSGFFKCLAELVDGTIDSEHAKDIYFDRQHAGVRTIIAVLDELVIGTASMLLEHKFIHGGSLVAHIEDVAVNYDYQNLGIGKMLIQELIKIAKEAGCYKAVLHCDAEKIGFYMKNNFYHIDGMRIDLGRLNEVSS